MDLQELSPNDMMLLSDVSKDEVDFVRTPMQNSHYQNNNNIKNSNIIVNGKINNEMQLTKINATNNKINNNTNNNSSTTTTTTATKVPKEHNHLNHHNHHNHHQRLATLFNFTRKSKPQEEKLKPETYNSVQTTTTSGFPCQTPQVPLGSPPRQRKFTKSSSIARLLGNNIYNAKKFEKEEKKISSERKFNTFGGRRRSGGNHLDNDGGASLERFKRYAKEEGDQVSEDKEPLMSTTTTMSTTVIPVISSQKKKDKSKIDTLDRHLMALEHFQDHHNKDFGSKAMRTISRGLGKLWWRRTHSIDISSPDPEFKVSYLGNVLTGWAKGEGCVEKQLNTLWRNYTQNNKPDVIMRLKVCASGLKATTRQHGLTEYWANRITHCCAPKNYPRVFCWIYRHEGRKLKHELRCHAVLCSKEKQVQEICDTLKANLECALREFKREKILKQNARLSLANAVYDNPSLPRRKILLSVGSNNYRPPLERSKSAPKLMAIEEAIGEEGEEAEETNEPEMKPCCQKDSLYPAMTLGRRRCRRGHSIRRTGKARPVSFALNDKVCSSEMCQNLCSETKNLKNEINSYQISTNDLKLSENKTKEEENRINYGSDESDDFEKILKHNNYDSNISLANELMPYFESQLHKNTSSSCGSLTDLGTNNDNDDLTQTEPLSLLSTINIDPNADPKNDFNPDKKEKRPEEEEDPINMVTLRRSGVCSDGEDDFLGEEEDDMYFRQAAILNMLHRHSMRKMANLSLSSDEGSSSLETNSGMGHMEGSNVPMNYKHQQQSSISSDTSSVSSAANHQQRLSENKRNLNNDSADEGSISSGCETASTVTQNQDDLSLQFRQSHVAKISLHLQANGDLEESSLEAVTLSAEDIYKHLQSRNNSDAATTFSSSSSITLKMDVSPCNSIKDLTTNANNSVDGLSKSASLNSNGLMTSSTMTMTTNLSRPTRRTRKQRDMRAADSDSECSDESGYVEYQGREKTNSVSSSNNNSNNSNSNSNSNSNNKIKLEQSPKPQLPIKPQIPPKPMPRRFINNSTSV